jgi:uncharacterized SAM-binding protein YcdF (DUF218 family)
VYYILSKTLDVLLMPLPMAFMALVYCLITKNQKRSKRLLLFTTIFLYLSSNQIIVNQIVSWWEGPAVSPSSITKIYTVGVVLTGGMSKGYEAESHNVWTGKAFDRTAQAFQLYQSGKIKKILISGGQGSMRGNVSSREGQEMAIYLIKSGVKREDIVLEGKSLNTRENAKFSALILTNQFKTNECILITSAFHLPRAMGCFKKVGIKPMAFSAHFMQEKTVFWFDQLLPNEEALYNFYVIFHEILGLTIYKILGYV